MSPVKHCKICSNSSDSVPWKKNYGKLVGFTCRLCLNKQSAIAIAAYRATEAGKAASDKSTKIYYASDKGKENNKRKRTSEGAKERYTEYSLTWAKRHPDKALAKVRKRDAVKLQRLPKWANHKKIQEIYASCPVGYQVDHIVPLKGKLVSGLHCELNLQYLTSKENASKGNKFDPSTFIGP